MRAGGAGDGPGDPEEEGAEAGSRAEKEGRVSGGGRIGTERRGVAGGGRAGGVVGVDTGRRSWWSRGRWGREDWRWRVVAGGGGPAGEVRAIWGAWGVDGGRMDEGGGEEIGGGVGKAGARWGGGGWRRRARAPFSRRGSMPVVTGFGCSGVISVGWGLGGDERQPNTETVVVITVAAYYRDVGRNRAHTSRRFVHMQVVAAEILGQTRQRWSQLEPKERDRLLELPFVTRVVGAKVYFRPGTEHDDAEKELESELRRCDWHSVNSGTSECRSLRRTSFANFSILAIAFQPSPLGPMSPSTMRRSSTTLSRLTPFVGCGTAKRALSSVPKAAARARCFAP